MDWALSIMTCSMLDWICDANNSVNCEFNACFFANYLASSYGSSPSKTSMFSCWPPPISMVIVRSSYACYCMCWCGLRLLVLCAATSGENISSLLAPFMWLFWNRAYSCASYSASSRSCSCCTYSRKALSSWCRSLSLFCC